MDREREKEKETEREREVEVKSRKTKIENNIISCSSVSIASSFPPSSLSLAHGKGSYWAILCGERTGSSTARVCTVSLKEWDENEKEKKDIYIYIERERECVCVRL